MPAPAVFRDGNRLQSGGTSGFVARYVRDAERNFLDSLVWARRQQAKFWELRRSTSLARLWQSQGKRQDAYELLAPVYG
jgi:hypothetical protein